MLKRLIKKRKLKQRIKELEYKISITKHSVKCKKLQQQLKELQRRLSS